VRAVDQAEPGGDERRYANKQVLPSRTAPRGECTRTPAVVELSAGGRQAEPRQRLRQRAQRQLPASAGAACVLARSSVASAALAASTPLYSEQSTAEWLSESCESAPSGEAEQSLQGTSPLWPLDPGPQLQPSG
jgi:hypothetical protein